jgi:hypothetical protein
MNANQLQEHVVMRLGGTRTNGHGAVTRDGLFFHTYSMPGSGQLRVFFRTNMWGEFEPSLASISNGLTTIEMEFDRTKPIVPQLNRLAITALHQ